MTEDSRPAAVTGAWAESVCGRLGLAGQVLPGRFFAGRHRAGRARGCVAKIALRWRRLWVGLWLCSYAEQARRPEPLCTWHHSCRRSGACRCSAAL